MVNEVTLSVVVPVWNQLRLSVQLLEHLDADPMPGREIIWVDNGSTDGTPAFLASLEERLQHKVLRFPENRGFGEAMNAGTAVASGEFLVLLNNDTEPSPGLLAELVACLRSDLSFGIVTPRVTQAGLRVNVFPESDLNRGPEPLERFGPAPSGVCYAISRHLFNALGGFDTETFKLASAEDADLCYKVWDMGREVVVHHSLCLKHLGAGTSSKLPDKASLWRMNAKLFEQKWKHIFAVRKKQMAKKTERENYEAAMVPHDEVLADMERALNSRSPWGLIRLGDGEYLLLNSIKAGKPLGAVGGGEWRRKVLTGATWQDAAHLLLAAIPKVNFVGLPWSGLAFGGNYSVHKALASHGIDWTRLQTTNVCISNYLAQATKSRGWMQRLCRGRNVGVVYRDVNHAAKRFAQIADTNSLICVEYMYNIDNASVVEELVQAGAEIVFVSGGPMGKALVADLKHAGLVALDYGHAIELAPDHNSPVWKQGTKGTRKLDGPPLPKLPPELKP